MNTPRKPRNNSDKEKTMNQRPRNPFVPEYQRPERIDTTWENRNDPTFREVLLRAGLNNTRRNAR